MDDIHDIIGKWSEIKLEILKQYATKYSEILSNQRNPEFYHIYIDAFAGSGLHRSRQSGKVVSGSPLNALNIKPPFREYHFIDLKKAKTLSLEKIREQRKDVYIYNEDCNKILAEIASNIQWSEYRRALCLLDPYGLNLNWNVIECIGKMKSIEIFLNFPILGMNRNALWTNPEKLSTDRIRKMNTFWGDESWRDVSYTNLPSLFKDIVISQKKQNFERLITQAFRTRLQEVAGFDYVPNPIPMRNSKNAAMYYLFFASYNSTGGKIVKDIFKKFS